MSPFSEEDVGEKNGNRNRTALVTGTTSGIGRELTELLAKDGFDLLLVARNGQKLGEQEERPRETYGVTVHSLAKDLCDPKSPEEVYADVQANDIHVDVLVNNAGFNEAGCFHKTDLGKELGMIQLHVATLTHLTKLFLPAMIEAGWGRIMNVGLQALSCTSPTMRCMARRRHTFCTFRMLSGGSSGGLVST